jgi:glutaredoxin
MRKMMRFALATAMLLASLPALALYKVVGPDGKVTYTDRAPVDASSKVTPLGRDGVQTVTATPDVDALLPVDLRQAVTKYPFTLYTGVDCAPCDDARQLLQQRGVPYTEKQVLSEADATVFELAVGARTIPGATLGPQPLRGFSPTDWNAYLDAAGYPRESKLPRSWQRPAPTPVVARAPAAAAPPQARASAPAPARPEVPPPAPGSIRF